MKKSKEVELPSWATGFMWGCIFSGVVLLITQKISSTTFFSLALGSMVALACGVAALNSIQEEITLSKEDIADGDVDGKTPRQRIMQRYVRLALMYLLCACLLVAGYAAFLYIGAMISSGHR